jgi:GNAT superfamily N-acetyltransferase
MVTVADCEHVQSCWFRARAALLGGEVWADGPLTWVDGPDGQNLMFPESMTVPGVRRGASRARARGRHIVGAWLSLRTDPSPLAAAGFDKGWSPWWMTADAADVTGPPDPRIELFDGAAGGAIGYPSERHELALARQRPARAWYAAAYTRESHSLAGRAWSFLDGDLAGIFNMDVAEPCRRQGLGTGLLRALCAAAREAGARSFVLNATPQGKRLYSACGFTQIGEGITWWLHLTGNN